jgi:hypothetical protein
MTWAPTSWPSGEGSARIGLGQDPLWTSDRPVNAPGGFPPPRGSAHLENDCFRDLDGLGADDSYGDDPQVGSDRLAGGLAAAASLEIGERDYEGFDSRPVVLALRVLGAPTTLTTMAASVVDADAGGVGDRRWV